ncbi:hypothetical protein JMM81_19440 [Bacillus sp. V3B]|uniref:hypothetical protein n=1 Tax=Bacillus sp. V3B TaxID=2804915 RepID=UPI00210BCC48|nr:hypothetical protein [Bacillus sp. V3B]MCQ6277054.1 hypothetical protein [Bacillus sp. V3B]
MSDTIHLKEEMFSFVKIRRKSGALRETPEWSIYDSVDLPYERKSGLFQWSDYVSMSIANSPNSRRKTKTFLIKLEKANEPFQKEHSYEIKIPVCHSTISRLELAMVFQSFRHSSI